MTDRSAAWLMLGFTGQAIFTARFLVQWLASERCRSSVVPVAFWWLSLLGGSSLLIYAWSRQDPVIVLGQSLGVLVYVRNLMLVRKNRRRAEKASRRAEAARMIREEAVAAQLPPCPMCKRAA
jgi:lipid-A-disaccharide synthase-like uncharacterized protein